MLQKCRALALPRNRDQVSRRVLWAVRVVVLYRRTFGNASKLWPRIDVSDEFLRDLKTSALFWVGPELCDRINRGNSTRVQNTRVIRAVSFGDSSHEAYRKVDQ